MFLQDGFTPLAVALQEGRDAVVSLLLAKEDQEQTKLPALHIAAKKDDVRSATLLLQPGNSDSNAAKVNLIQFVLDFLKCAEN